MTFCEDVLAIRTGEIRSIELNLFCLYVPANVCGTSEYEHVMVLFVCVRVC